MANRLEVKKSRFSSPGEATIEGAVSEIGEEVAHMAIAEAIKIDLATMEIVLLVGISEIGPEDASTAVKRVI